MRRPQCLEPYLSARAAARDDTAAVQAAALEGLRAQARAAGAAPVVLEAVEALPDRRLFDRLAPEARAPFEAAIALLPEPRRSR